MGIHFVDQWTSDSVAILSVPDSVVVPNKTSDRDKNLRIRIGSKLELPKDNPSDFAR